VNSLNAFSVIKKSEKNYRSFLSYFKISQRKEEPSPTAECVLHQVTLLGNLGKWFQCYSFVRQESAKN